MERCEKLKHAYGNLRQEHINLIRAHAETKKSLESQEQLLTDITQQLESKNTGSSQQLRNLEVCTYIQLHQLTFKPAFTQSRIHVHSCKFVTYVFTTIYRYMYCYFFTIISQSVELEIILAINYK